MRVGIPKEIKRFEHRTAITQDGVRALKAAGHSVYIEKGGPPRVENDPGDQER